MPAGSVPSIWNASRIPRNCNCRIMQAIAVPGCWCRTPQGITDRHPGFRLPHPGAACTPDGCRLGAAIAGPGIFR